MFLIKLLRCYVLTLNIVMVNYICFILLEDVIKTYQSAQSNFSVLDKSGASHLHEVDATKMKFHSGLIHGGDIGK